MDTAQVDEAYSLMGGSDLAGGAEECDYVDLSGATASESVSDGVCVI